MINALLAAVILGMLFYMVRDSLPSAVAEIKHLSLNRFVLASVCAAIYFILEGITLAALVKKQAPQYAWKHGILCVFYTKLWALMTFNVGATIGCMLHMNRDGIEYTQAFGIKTVHYDIHKFSVALFSAVCAVLFWQNLDHDNLQKLVFIGLALNLLLCLCLVLPCVMPSLQQLLVSILKKIDRKGKFEKQIEEFSESLKRLEKGTKNLFADKKLMISAIMQTCFKSAFAFMINWACIGAKFESIPLCLALSSLEQMLAGVIPNPTGVGSKELMHLILFTPVFGRTKAVSGMILYQFFFNAVGLILGLFSLIELKMRKNNVANHESCLS